MDLEELKKTIEILSKEQHIEVLKIIHEFSPATINENKSGIYINMAFLNKDTIEKLTQYISYIQDQEQMLKPFECQKEDFKNTFFIEKELKDSMLYSFRN
jgi:transcriptional regulator of heat shock response